LPFSSRSFFLSLFSLISRKKGISEAGERELELKYQLYPKESISPLQLGQALKAKEPWGRKLTYSNNPIINKVAIIYSLDNCFIIRILYFIY